MDSRNIEEMAARWLARRESGAWAESDEADLEAWLAAQTAHRIEYLRVQASWKQAARLQALGAGVPKGVIPPRGTWGNIRFLRSRSLDTSASIGGTSTIRPRRAAVFSGVAASLALIVGVLIYNMGVFSGTRYATPVGGADNVSLTDGSRVTLNTNTRIRVLLTEKERRIQLDRGEAFFDVAKDAARPFVVYAGSQRVMAVGTKFSVRRDRDDVQVVVTEGRVSLAAQLAGVDDAGRSGSAPIEIPPPTLLSAGSVARTSHTQVLVRTAAATEAEKLLSWRSGYLIFDNATLAEAVAEFNRYTRRRIVIEDPAIAGLRIGGNFRSNNSDAFLWLLQRGFPVQIEQGEHEVILKSR